ncbi:ribonuclease R [Chthoniobacter flavus Ellin428]|uniref:Ribonuclease R n=1 Tax=Chthoniobacter flavus Ellin428 TaxID=497964 RepID=B4D6L0_9BACT|nr:ribonuclease R [Chthoniobacter flavus]EDY17811.1 ribonuclease R [Chthoniobacter flavus Ellin428]TCO88423.1 ribonuclease R [Chthoniobacter flavus]
MKRNKKQPDQGGLKERIRQLLRNPNYRPLDKVELSKALRWPSDQRAELREALRELETAGEIARIRKDRYVLPQTADLVTGILQVHANGHAHLLSETPGVKDVFISAPNLGTAMHSDKVVARLMHEGREQRRGGAQEARVIKILERANDTIVGTLQSSKNFFYVIPDDPRLQHNIYVKPEPKGAQVGDKVVVRFEEWESRHVNPEGEVIEVLGPAHAPGVDMLSIIRKYQLPMAFPDAVEREAEKIFETVHPDEIARREDCRGQFIVTIDPDDAKDFDDAIHVERLARGWRLGVHIADVSHYVRPGHPLDREARKRGNSTYLADRVIPMLPERLSNGICSLKPGVERLTFGAFIDFDESGKIRKARFARSVIKSAARLTYRQALAILEDRPVPATPNYERGGKVHLDAKPVPLNVTPELRERVKLAWELASLLRKNRFAAGSLDLDFPEVKVWLDDQGRAVRLEKMDNDISHQLVEEFMLAANEVVAKALKDRKIPTVYRIHEDPDPDRLADYRELAISYGFRAGDLTQRRELQRLLAATRGKPEEYALKLGLLKSLKRARYATDPVGHYGLAKVNYTHFTSPIRRYADLLVHRALAGEKLGGVGAVGEIAAHISTTERTSADAERDSTMLKKMEFFQRQLTARRPEEMRAIVVDVRSYGLVVELPDCLITGLIHVSSLPDDFYQFDSTRLRFVGRRKNKTYQIGDVLQVIVSRVDAYKRQIDFVPVK